MEIEVGFRVIFLARKPSSLIYSTTILYDYVFTVQNNTLYVVQLVKGTSATLNNEEIKPIASSIHLLSYV